MASSSAARALLCPVLLLLLLSVFALPRAASAQSASAVEGDGSLSVSSRLSNGGDSNYSHCDTCLTLAQFVDEAVQSPFTLDALEKAAIAYCIPTEWEKGEDCSSWESCSALCRGVVGEYAAIIVGIAVNTTLSAADMCWDINLCPAPTPAGPPIPGVPVPANVSDLTGQRQWAMWNASSGSGRILHLSDLHLDVLYSRHARTHCSLDLCCRNESDGSGDAGVFGDYNCDSPQALLDSLLSFLNSSLTPRPDFVLYTGDDPAHDIWQQTFDSNLAAIASVSAQLQRHFPDIPVFSAIGNHEACPVNLFAGPGTDSWLYRQLVVDWAYYLPHQAQRTLNYGGYYAALIRPGLYVVSINSNIYVSDDAYVDPRDPQDLSAQLPWLNNTLQQIAALGAKAIIIGHASPYHWYDAFRSAFHQLLLQYAPTVQNLFWGHTHDNEVQLYHADDSPLPHAVGYIGGSVTPFTNTNPGFSVYQYERSLKPGFLVQDIAYHWINLTAANQQLAADWQPVRVSALTDYSLPDLSPLSWYQLAESMRANGSQAAYVSMQQALSKGLYSGGGGSEQDRKSFACDVENDSQAEAADCRHESGLDGQRAARPFDREDSYHQLLADCSGKSSGRLEQVRAHWLELVEKSRGRGVEAVSPQAE